MTGIFFIIKVKIPMPSQWSYNPPTTQLCRVLGLELLSYSEHVVQSLLNTIVFVSVLGVTPNHIGTLRYRSPIKICNQIRHVYLSCKVQLTLRYIQPTIVLQYCE